MKKWDQSTYVSKYISYAKRVAAETENEETAEYPQEKDRMKTNDIQIEIEEGRNRKKKIGYFNVSNARKKTARKGNTHTSSSQQARGGCSAETK